jgi:hypothetical protein
VASAAKSKAAFFADGQELLGWFVGLRLPFAFRILVVIFGGRVVGVLGQLEALGLLVLLGSRGAVTPLPRAIDGVLVRLKLDLVLERHVALDYLLVEWDLQQLAGVDEGPGLLAFPAGWRRCLCALFGTVGREASDCGNISFLNGIVVEVLQTLDAEDVPAVHHPMADGAFLGFWQKLKRVNDT